MLFTNVLQSFLMTQSGGKLLINGEAVQAKVHIHAA
jgi:hypothetical protein